MKSGWKVRIVLGLVFIANALVVRQIIASSPANVPGDNTPKAPRVTSTKSGTSSFALSPTTAPSGMREIDEEIKDTYLVTRVIDGDTIEIQGGEKVRYIGVDTPETKHPRKPVQCFGRQAAEKNKQLVEGKMVRLEKDVSEADRYGRLLRYVYAGDVFVNLAMVKQGYAYAATFPPDVKYQELFSQAQREAREGRRGLWGECK